jgi:hypothetical protein
MNFGDQVELLMILNLYPSGCAKPFTYSSTFPEDCHTDFNDLPTMILRAYRLSAANISYRNLVLLSLPARVRDRTLDERRQASTIRLEIIEYMGLLDHFRTVMNPQQVYGQDD